MTLLQFRHLMVDVSVIAVERDATSAFRALLESYVRKLFPVCCLSAGKH